MKIDIVTSRGGIQAWLLEDHFVPAFVLRYAFHGGSSQDPEGKAGLAYFLGSIFGEGFMSPGPAFESQAEALGIHHHFFVSKDSFSGVLETLSENRCEAASFLGSLLGQPPLSPNVIETGRERLLSSLAAKSADPRHVAFRQWDALAFAGHPYAQPTKGNSESLHGIEPEDLDDYRRRVLARDTLKVVAVGSISGPELEQLLDEAFGRLPTAATLTPVPEVALATGGQQSIAELGVPQSTVVFGMGVVPANHPDYAATLILNHILGGPMASRLVEAIRSKRGLAHEVRSSIHSWHHGSALRGTLATRNAMVGEGIEILRNEFARLAHGELTAAELDSAKRSLLASQVLRLQDNLRTSTPLLRGLLTGSGPYYLHTRNVRIGAVSLEEARRVARRWLAPENLIVSVAGAPALRAKAS